MSSVNLQSAPSLKQSQLHPVLAREAGPAQLYQQQEYREENDRKTESLDQTFSRNFLSLREKNAIRATAGIVKNNLSAVK